MSEHTKTPWVQDKFGSLLGQDGKTVTVWGLGIAHGLRSEETEANARHIVHCVNNHERLVAMLEEATTQLEIVHYHDGNEFVGARAKEARTLLAALEAEKGGE